MQVSLRQRIDPSFATVCRRSGMSPILVYSQPQTSAIGA